MTRRSRLELGIGLVLLLVAIISMANTWTMASYIRRTEPRDAAQEQCIVDQSVWLQDWLHWRWVEHINATSDEIIAYQQEHPQPPCEIKR